MSLTTTSPSRTLYCGNGSTAVQLRQFRDFARGIDTVSSSRAAPATGRPRDRTGDPVTGQETHP
jgi:hypothetical protein